MTNPITRPIRKSSPVLLFLCFLCLSCNNGTVYNQYRPISRFIWEKNREYSFACTISDTAAAYNISFEVRNNNLYPYQNLWIFCAEESPAGTIRRDTVECMLADEFGKWSGKGISIFQSSFPLRTGYKFPHSGQYTFRFRQGMRNDTLRGIREIGLRVEQAR